MTLKFFPKNDHEKPKRYVSNGKSLPPSVPLQGHGTPPHRHVRTLPGSDEKELVAEGNDLQGVEGVSGIVFLPQPLPRKKNKSLIAPVYSSHLDLTSALQLSKGWRLRAQQVAPYRSSPEGHFFSIQKRYCRN